MFLHFIPPNIVSSLFVKHHWTTEKQTILSCHNHNNKDNNNLYDYQSSSEHLCCSNIVASLLRQILECQPHYGDKGNSNDNDDANLNEYKIQDQCYLMVNTVGIVASLVHSKSICFREVNILFLSTSRKHSSNTKGTNQW